MTNPTPQPLPDRRQLGVIYARISKDEFGDELAVQRHIRECQRLADSLGITVPPEWIFCDNDRSGSKVNVKRPGWDDTRAVLRTGAAGNLITKDSDRLSRQDLRHVEDLIDLLQGNAVMLHSVNSGMFDLNTVDGRERARGAAVRAKAEVERMSKRLRDKMADLVEQGKPNGGPTPYGYRRKGAKTPEGDTRQLVIDRAEAKVVVEIMTRVARGETLSRIATSLNDRGLQTSRGGRWTLTNTRRIALNGLYAGRRVHKGVEVTSGVWPAIVEEGLWRQAVAVLTSPDRARRRSNRRYLLTGGLLLCGKCGNPLYSKVQHQARYTMGAYACKSSVDTQHPGCGGVTVRADKVEELVSDWIIGRVESKEFATNLRQQERGNPKASEDARSLEAKLRHYEELLVEEKLTEPEYFRLRGLVLKKLDTAQTAMTVGTSFAAVGRYAGKKGVLRLAWYGTEDQEGMDLDTKQAIVRSVIESITIAPVGRRGGKTFDPSRVGTPVWKV